MTKADLIEVIHDKVGLSKKESADIVELVFETMKQTLESSEKIKISGFGNFEVRNKNLRIGRNPKTGESIEISARRVLSSSHLSSKSRKPIIQRLIRVAVPGLGLPVKGAVVAQKLKTSKAKALSPDSLIPISFTLKLVRSPSWSNTTSSLLGAEVFHRPGRPRPIRGGTTPTLNFPTKRLLYDEKFTLAERSSALAR